MKTNVALTSGSDRYGNINKALELIKDDIDLTGKKDIFIKVNFVDIENQVAVTHVDGVQALLEFIRRRYNGKITIGESTLQCPVKEAFENFGYTKVLKDYHVDIFDMKEDDWKILHLYDSKWNPMDIHYSKRMLESDYLISIGPPKTHDMVIVTLSIKNVVMGGPSHKFGDKIKIHQEPAVMNLNLYLMAIQHLPELAVIDGLIGMEGDGPVQGEAVGWNLAVASCNAVTADCLTADLMGYPPDGVGYLHYLSKKGYGTSRLDEMNILGDTPDIHRRKFRPHSMYEYQKKWPDERVSKYLGI